MWRIVGVGAAWTIAWWLIIGALLAPVVPGGWIAVGVATLLAIAPLLILVRRFRGHYPSAFVRVWVFRPFWYVQLAAPLTALAGLIGVIAGSPFGVATVAGRVALLAVAATFTAAAAAGYVGTRLLRVKALDAWCVDLPAGLEGMRVVQISDLHVGPHTPRRYLARVAAAVQRAGPDLIAVTGDQVDDYPGDVAHFAAAFAALSAPLGVFAVAGNHDVYAGWPEVRSGLEAMGVTVLVNDAVDDRAPNRIGSGLSAREIRPASADPSVAGARSRPTSPARSHACRRTRSPLHWLTTRDCGLRSRNGAST